MKTTFLCLLTVAFISTAALADAIRTNVLVSGDPPLIITVPDARVLTVLNFFSNGAGLANLAVTKDGKSTQILFPIDISFLSAERPKLIVAGPATVTVTNGSQSVVVSYRLDPNQ